MGRVGKAYTIHPALQAFVGLEMAAVIVAAFLYAPPAANFASPDAARIIIFHVPCAAVATVAYVVSAAYAIGYLRARRLASDAKSAASASLGFLFTVLATVTGMIFARIEWGTAWNWDPRETSILMLLIVYGAYFALRSALSSGVDRARISAAYNVLAGVIMPFFVFVMPRIGPASLHPERASLSSEYRIVMGAALLGYLLLYVWMFKLAVRIKELEAVRRRK